MKKSFIRLLSAGLFSGMITACSGPSDYLFDGKTLEGWTCDPESEIDHWTVSGGELIGENPDQQASILWTTGTYGNFEIELEYMALTKDYDSGIFLRGLSHQVQIGISRSLARDMTGCIYAPEDGQGGYPGQTDKVEEYQREGEWNHLRVIIEGKRIQTFLNGEPFVDYHAINLVSGGPIGLQLHQGVHMGVKFRNIKLREIPYQEIDFSPFPSAVISNAEVNMNLYLPDPENGMYRGTRFDWSGVIGSVQYKSHEYFGYWKQTHDPTFHEDLAGPVEGFLEPGLGYAEAPPGGKFIRIGIGVLEKDESPYFNWRKTYHILDHGIWEVNQGDDWITFTHELSSEIGYAYMYQKTITLKEDGFTIQHILENRGSKIIETDQFNHNFLMIDGEPSGTAFQISFPWNVSTDDDAKGYVEIAENRLDFVKDVVDDNFFLLLEGYGDGPDDHRITVLNRKSGAGVHIAVDKPLYRMAFWACETTLSPENSIWISVEPGKSETWTSDYTLFLEE